LWERPLPFLIARIATGDRLAMQTLFARHRLSVYRWIVRIVRDEDLAEDLLSEVFPRRMAPSRKIRVTRIGFDLAVGNRPL
jgi:DNA-directed RNA polymerase specialized sigma24 family protein